MYYLEINLDNCDGCGICVAVCPHNASFDVMTRGGKGVTTPKVYIGVKGGSSSVLGEHVESEYCGECVINCPNHAIRLVVPPMGEAKRTLRLGEEAQAEEVTIDEQQLEFDPTKYDMERAEGLGDALAKLQERYKKRQVRQAVSRGNIERAEKLLTEE